MLTRISLVLWLLLALSCSPNFSIACEGPLTYWGIWSNVWQSPLKLHIYTDIEMVQVELKATFNYSGVFRVYEIDDSPNTKARLEGFEGAALGVISGHANPSGGIEIEYHSDWSDASNSVTGMGLVHSGEGQNVTIREIQYGGDSVWGITIWGSTVPTLMQAINYNEHHMVMYAQTCYGDKVVEKLNNGTSMIYGGAGAYDEADYGQNSPLLDDEETFWSRILCTRVGPGGDPNWLQDFVIACADLLYIESYHPNYNDEQIRMITPNPCRSCNTAVEPAVDVRLHADVITWKANKNSGIRYVVTRDTDDGRRIEYRSMPLNRAHYFLPVEPLPKGQNYYVVAYDENSVVAEIEIVGDRECRGDIGVYEELLITLQSSMSDVQSERWFGPCDYLVVGKNWSCVDQVADDLAQRFPDKIVGRRGLLPYEGGDDVRNHYSNIHYENICANLNGAAFPVSPEGPTLIIVGGVGENPDAYLNPISYEDINGVCMLYSGPPGEDRICKSDWLMTDINGDNIPDGPVVRIPTYSATEISRLLSNARDFSEGINVDVQRRRLFLVAERETNYLDHAVLMAARMNPYFPNIDIVGSSQAAGMTDAERWDWGLQFFNQGVFELWGFGYVASRLNWFEVLMYSSGYTYELYTERSNFVAFAPNCFTSHSSGTGPSLWRDFMFGEAAQGAGCVSFIGMYSGTYDNDLVVILDHLWKERENAIYEGATTAQIAHRAIRAILTEFPFYWRNIGPLQVYGGIVFLGGGGDIGGPTSVYADLPPALGISAIAPNPFNPSTTVWMELPKTGSVTVAVHDLRGRLVRTLWQGSMDAGRHPIMWDGMDGRGQQAASGVYLVRMVTADGEQRTAKITLAK